MLNANQTCFLLLPNEANKRLLVPGKVVNREENLVTAEFEEAIGLEAGAQTMVYADVRGKFLQQAVVISGEVDQRKNSPQGGFPLGLVLSGEPVSAESRGSYRVSVAASQLYAKVGDQRECHVVDVSPEGCAVICEKPLKIGQTVEISFSFDTICVTGPMKVQTVKTLRNGTQRYGLYAAEKKSVTRHGLERISMQMQRLQLKRFAGAA